MIIHVYCNKCGRCYISSKLGEDICDVCQSGNIMRIVPEKYIKKVRCQMTKRLILGYKN